MDSGADRVLARMRSGVAVMGDVQHLPGYSVLVYDDPSVEHLSALEWGRRQEFLFDLSLLGEAVEAACRDRGLARINYEILGNSDPRLHGHVHARYVWEPEALRSWPVWSYPAEVVEDPQHAYDERLHGELRVAITRELGRLMAAAYGGE